ncbi:two-component system response regulator [Verrucomicrobia bacterium LW23]|nr:two-component system response regulator [Verrucomicrobia bacterium LW23]
MKNKRVMVVDDERHMQRLLHFNLEKTGCIVLPAMSGEDALEKAAATTVDLLIVDVMMPGIDGFTTVRKLREVPGYEHLPIIMLTARGQADVREAAAGLGISDFLTKPFSPIELVTRARELIGSDREGL